MSQQLFDHFAFQVVQRGVSVLEFEDMKSQWDLGNRGQGIWAIYIFSAIWVLDVGATAICRRRGYLIPWADT